MDERKNKMTDQRYREILPMAYMTAAIEKGRQPRPVEVGLCARAIVDAGDENNLAYRVAMATKIHCTIVGVKRVSTKTGYDKYEITYRTFGKDEDETIPSPLIGDFRYGKVTGKACCALQAQRPAQGGRHVERGLPLLRLRRSPRQVTG